MTLTKENPITKKFYNKMNKINTNLKELRSYYYQPFMHRYQHTNKFWDKLISKNKQDFMKIY